MKHIIIVLGIMTFIFGIALVFAFPTMWLWNWLMPSIFGLTKITFWQALGVNLLSGILFRSGSVNNNK